MDAVKVQDMIRETLCDVDFINVSENKIHVKTLAGEKKVFLYFESQETVGLKNEFGKVIIERFK